MYVQTRTYNPPTYVHTYAHTYTYAYTRTLIHTYTHTHTHTHILHTCTYTYTYAYTYTYTYTHAYTHAHIHIHTYTYTHTHIHTYTHALIDCYHAFPGKYTKPHETTTKPVTKPLVFYRQIYETTFLKKNMFLVHINNIYRIHWFRRKCGKNRVVS